METLLIIGGIWLVCVIFDKSSRNRGNRQNPRPDRPRSTPGANPNTPSAMPKANPNKETFRPVSNGSPKPTINFNTAKPTNQTKVASVLDLEDLHDAFTGAPLDKSLGLYQCQSCRVYYHTESVQILREANGSQCAACPSTNIISVIIGSKATGGKDYKPNVVTLQNYRKYEASVVTFEARVIRVNESSRGNDFAVMFEDKKWSQGFKLVFFRDGVRKVGGRPFITQLAGKVIKVRGLIINHPKYGYEIIVSEKSMILEVK